MADLKVTFTLGDQDLAHLRRILKKAGAAAKGQPPEAIARAAIEMAKRAREAKPPSYVVERIEKLETIVQIADDRDWALPPLLRQKVLTALAYFTNPADLIPDSVPGLGFLDDAIMIELVAQDLRHEIKAYREFRRFRATAEQRPWTRVGKASLEKRLARKRGELRARISAGQARQAERSRSSFLW